ncbi:ester cyclase [Paenibacillus alginolyticus]|uniref:Ester cyclase n=1 Tax=Paenibacillus alginolyticus TaxID=59839 RepID=A0ABT4GLC2_9BACL|nr:ester cyclase [Paenibacillus alginolyticus]MCY9696988.1 ester cyclase [Paenibacillus alginolyticus]MEC0147374.1 ester cyclase [Paenibacillus alginolyticus]
MTPTEIVQQFFNQVRSGKQPDAAIQHMAEQVLAHQMTAENETTVHRTPANYADHVREMIAAYGDFHLEVQELIAQDDRVYVRWKQTGTHIGEVDGFPPTGQTVIEIASAVYRIENERIVEYWIQIDREGIRLQLQRNA